MSKRKAKNKLSFVIYFGIFVFIVDFLSKLLVSHNISLMSTNDLWYPYGGIGVFENFFGIEFSIVHALNRGAAWGVFSDYQQWLLIARILLITGLLAYALVFNKNRQYDIPLALIISGALGNIIDFFIYGHVIDMFNFVFWGYNYPVFNVADSAICIGIFWLVLFSHPNDTRKGKR